MSGLIIEIFISIIWIGFFMISGILFRLTKRNVNKESYSKLGCDKLYGNIFNRVLIFTGIMQLIFLASLYPSLISFIGFSGQIGLIGLLITTIMGVCTGMVPLNRNSQIHVIFGIIGFVSAMIGWVALASGIILNNPLIGGIFAIFGLFIIPPLLPIYLKYKRELPAIYESLFFLSAYITDICIFWFIKGN
jgi:hypothetical protein